MPSPETQAGQTDAVEDRSVSILRGSMLAAPIALALVGGIILGHRLLWGQSPLAGFSVSVSTYVILAIGVVVHEGLHAIGFRAAGAPRSAIHFGFHALTLTPYATCTYALSASRYRFAVLFPGLVLGVVPAAIGLSIDATALSLFGATFAGVAGGDLLVWGLLRGIPGPSMVRDHPTRMGSLVVRWEAAGRNPKAVV